MAASARGLEEQAILEAVSLPAVAPMSDRRAGSIARRTGIELEHVEAILTDLERQSPRRVRRVSDPRVGEFWITTR
jgi:hypothetical protein